jgi:hypothetical protein
MEKNNQVEIKEKKEKKERMCPEWRNNMVELTSAQRLAAEKFAEGLSVSKVVEITGIDRHILWILRTKNTEFRRYFDELLTERVEATRKAFQGAAAKAFENLLELSESSNDRIRLDATKALLDRGGFSSEIALNISKVEKTSEERLSAEDVRLYLESKNKT